MTVENLIRRNKLLSQVLGNIFYHQTFIKEHEFFLIIAIFEKKTFLFDNDPYCHLKSTLKFNQPMNF